MGTAVAEALQAGQELPRRLECPGHGIAGTLDLPPVPGLRRWIGRKACQAYHCGCVGSLAANPKEAVAACAGALEPNTTLTVG